MKFFINTTLFLCCLFLSVQVLGQCASYTNPTVPPPYPEDYPCMMDLFVMDPACCDVDFDNMCLDQLKMNCGVTAGDGAIENCYKDPRNGFGCGTAGCDGSCKTRIIPYGSTGCPVWGTPDSDSPLASPPRVDPSDPSSAELDPFDPCVMEIFSFDPFCCNCPCIDPPACVDPIGCNPAIWTGWDMCCQLVYDDITSPDGASTTYSVCGYGLGILGEEPRWPCDDFDNGTNDKCDGDLGCINIPVLSDASAPAIKVRVLLEGAFNVPMLGMNTNLTAFLPSSHPFSGAPWNHGGTESVSSFDPAVVDWVLVSAVEEATGNIVESRAALLLNNSDVMDIDGTVGSVKFLGGNVVLGDRYFTIVRSRNHGDIISKEAKALPNSVEFDLTRPVEVLGEEQQVKDVGSSRYAMYAGDMNGDGIMNYRDFTDHYMMELGSSNGYYSADLDLDGDVDQDDFNLYEVNRSHIGVGIIRF